MATRTIGTEIVMSGEKAFNDAMKSVNSNLKNLRSDMAVVTAEFDGNANSVEALTAKQKILEKSTDQHRAKVDALRRMYEKTKEASGENSAAADKLKIELNNATAAMLKEENALKKTVSALEQLEQDAKDAAKAEKQEAEAAEKAAKKQELHTKQLEKAHKRASALEAAFKSLGSATLAVSKTTVAASAALTAAGGAALIGLINLAKEAAEAAKAAHEAGEEMTASEIEWYKFSRWMDDLDDSADRAKAALASVLLPALSELSIKGGAFLERFSRNMEAASGDTKRQTELLGQYIAEGALLIAENLPKYIESGKNILSGIGQGLAESEDELLEVGFSLLSDFLQYVVDNAPMLAEGGLELVLEIIEGIDGKDLSDTAAKLVTRLSDAIANKAPKLLSAAVSLIGELQLGLAENSPALVESGVYLVAQLVVGIFMALIQWRKTADLVVDTLVERLGESYGAFVEVGARIIGWIAEGVLSGVGTLPAIIRDVVEKMTSNRTAARVDTSWNTANTEIPNAASYLDKHAADLRSAGSVDGGTSNAKRNKYSEVNIYTSSLSQSDLDLVFSYVDEKLGG